MIKKWGISLLLAGAAGIVLAHVAVVSAAAEPEEFKISVFPHVTQHGSSTIRKIGGPIQLIRGLEDPNIGGMRNVGIAIQYQKGGPEKGKYFVGVYLKDTGTGPAAHQLLSFIPRGKMLLVSYTETKRHLGVFCKRRDECTVAQWSSTYPSVRSQGVIGTVYIIGQGEGLVAVRRSDPARCDVIVGRGTREVDNPFEDWGGKHSLFLEHGERGELPGVGSVRCRVEQTGASLEFADIR